MAGTPAYAKARLLTPQPFPHDFLRAAQREFTQNAVAVFVALFAILISTVLIRLLGQAAGGRVPADAVLALIGFRCDRPDAGGALLTLFIAILMSLSRSYRDPRWSCGSPAGCRSRPGCGRCCALRCRWRC